MNHCVVLDTSVALSWVLPDEDQSIGLNLRARAVGDGTLCLLVPPIFWPEVANVLTIAIRRSRIDLSFARQSLDALQNFGLDEYNVLPKESLELAIAAQISAYDAQYLVLAQRTSASFWTLDKRLRLAAKSSGIAVEPDPEEPPLT